MKLHFNFLWCFFWTSIFWVWTKAVVLQCIVFPSPSMFFPPDILEKPLGPVVVMRGISGRCERVRAENISPSFWGCQDLDKSCLNFTLCKMPCVNSCPWPKCSDLVRQTPRAAHPSWWDLGWQRARVQFRNFIGFHFGLNLVKSDKQQTATPLKN